MRIRIVGGFEHVADFFLVEDTVLKLPALGAGDE